LNETHIKFGLLFGAKKGLLLLCMLTITAVQNVNAQFFNAKSKFSVDNGLPSNEVFDLLHDSKGFMWMATDFGLARFDGTGFKQFGIEDGLTKVTVLQLKEDAQGNIWALTLTGEFFVFNGEKFEAYAYNTMLLSYYAKENLIISSFVVLQDKSLQIVFRNSNIIGIDKHGSLEVLHVPNEYNYIFIDEDTVHFRKDSRGQRNLLKLVRNGVKEIVPLPYQVLKKQTYGPPFVLPFLVNEDVLFFYDDQCVQIHRDNSFSNHTFPYGICSYELIDNILLIGTFNGGLLVYDIDALDKGYIAQLHEGNTITKVELDFEGGIWCSSLSNGVYYYVGVKALFQPVLGKEINAMTIDSAGEIWVGTKDGFICNIRGEYMQKVSRKIYGLALVPGTDELFIAGNEGEYRYNTNTNQLREQTLSYIDPVLGKLNVKRSLKYVHRTTTGSLIFGTHLDVYQYKDGTYTKNGSPLEFSVTIDREYHDNHLSVSGRICDGQATNNGLAIATNKGLYWMGEKGAVARDSIIDWSNYSLTSFAYDERNEVLWIGTKVNGLFHYALESKKLTHKKGVPYNGITDLALIKEELLIATNSGAWRLKYASGIDEQPAAITLNDGLFGHKINCLLISDSLVFIGTNVGVSSIVFPIQLQRKQTYPFYLSQLINGKEHLLSSGSKLLLTPEETSLNLHCTGISYRYSKEVSYAYTFDAGEDNWNPVEGSYISFPALAYGSYALRIRMEVSNTEHQTEEYLLHIDVAPSFWQRPMVLIEINVLVLLFIFWFVLLRIRRIRKRNQLQERLIQLRLETANLKQKALRAQINPHFFFNGLTAIQSFVVSGDEEAAEDYLLRFARLMRMVLQGSAEDWVPLEDECEMLLLYLGLMQEQYPNFSYEVHCDETLEADEFQIPPMVIQPILENAIVHGMVGIDSGTIVVDFRFEEEKISVTVSDNGKGREQKTAQSEQQRSYGTAIVEERIRIFSKQHHREYALHIRDLKNEDGESEGTQVCVELPFQ